METEDVVPYITRKHFEEGLASARKSVTAYDLDKFEQFRKKYDPAYAAKVSGAATVRINWPEDKGGQRMFENPEEDEDLYS